jgi:hypothetical protein
MPTGVTGVGKEKFVECYRKNERQTQAFAVRYRKNARQAIFYRAFFLCRAPYIKRTAKRLFAVRPK